MKYFFILGSNPTLSLAELASVFSDGRLALAQTNIATLETDTEIKADLLYRIGGTIKFGLIYDELTTPRPQDILKAAAIFAKPEKTETKFYFGISFYGKAKINLKVLGMEFKKLLKLEGISSRWVISREPTLSSVVVEQNKLTTAKGAEIVIIQFDKKLLIGKTLAVQPFKELSFRDYGRPARDDRSGMLPPKLAQIMINLALPPFRKGGRGAYSSPYEGEDKGEVTILDPFCGSGTIVTEAMLMGHTNIIGSDISPRAVDDTKKNIAWTEKNYEIQNTKYKILTLDASQITKQIQPNSIDAIITEPYLGPQRGGFDRSKIVKDLERLYEKSLMEFKKILKPDGRIVMVWPVFSGQFKSIFINPSLAGLKIINPIPDNLQKNIFLKLTDRETIVYGREEQKVWREIVVLEK